MSEENIEQIVHWVNGDVRAVLVQLPKTEYQTPAFALAAPVTMASAVAVDFALADC